MKRLILLFIVILMSFDLSIAQDLEKIAEIKINTVELAKKVNFQSTKFIFRSKQSTGYHLAFDFADILKPYLKGLSKKDKLNLVIVAENENGESVTATYADIDMSLTSMPAVLIYHKVAVKDSITLQEKNGKMDMSELDEDIANLTTRRRIHLQIKRVPVAEKIRIMNDATLIFPKDINTERWINGIDLVKIYKYKSQRVPPVEENLEIKPDIKKTIKKRNKFN